VIEYQGGRDKGDHRIAGFTNEAAEQAGKGITFSDWSVFDADGSEGTFRWS
jgi:hypothetical protein